MSEKSILVPAVIVSAPAEPLTVTESLPEELQEAKVRVDRLNDPAAAMLMTKLLVLLVVPVMVEVVAILPAPNWFASTVMVLLPLPVEFWKLIPLKFRKPFTPSDA